MCLSVNGGGGGGGSQPWNAKVPGRAVRLAYLCNRLNRFASNITHTHSHTHYMCAPDCAEFIAADCMQSLHDCYDDDVRRSARPLFTAHAGTSGNRGSDD